MSQLRLCKPLQHRGVATYVSSFSSSMTGICAPDCPNEDVRDAEPWNELLREDDSPCCCCCSNDAVRDDDCATSSECDP